MFAHDIHNHCNQHDHPHQVFFNELMREFDPKDPANKNRTFDKMVQAANRKHLNPGEQSFHYYIDKTDGKVHGFLAVGNINDRLPHIIITDNTDGKESALERIERTLKILYKQESTLETIQAQIEDLLNGVEFPDDLAQQLEEFNTRLAELESKLENIPEGDTLIQINQFIENNQEFFTEENNTTITDVIEKTVSESITENIGDKVNEAVDTKMQEVLGEGNETLTDAVTNIIVKPEIQNLVQPDWENLD